MYPQLFSWIQPVEDNLTCNRLHAWECFYAGRVLLLKSIFCKKYLNTEQINGILGGGGLFVLEYMGP